MYIGHSLIYIFNLVKVFTHVCYSSCTFRSLFSLSFKKINTRNSCSWLSTDNSCTNTCSSFALSQPVLAELKKLKSNRFEYELIYSTLNSIYICEFECMTVNFNLNSKFRNLNSLHLIQSSIYHFLEGHEMVFDEVLV